MENPFDVVAEALVLLLKEVAKCHNDPGTARQAKDLIKNISDLQEQSRVIDHDEDEENNEGT